MGVQAYAPIRRRRSLPKKTDCRFDCWRGLQLLDVAAGSSPAHGLVFTRRASLLKTVRPFRSRPHRCGKGVAVSAREHGDLKIENENTPTAVLQKSAEPLDAKRLLKHSRAKECARR